MAEWEFFDEDPLMLTRQWFRDNEDGTYTIATEEDIGALLQDNYEQRMARDPHPRWGGGKIGARLPPTVLYDLLARGIIEQDWDLNTTKFKNWYNSSDNIWRIFPGRV